jgi:FAD/FMN-containing dehydrogenase
MRLNRREFCQSAVAAGLTGAMPAGVVLAQESRTYKNMGADVPALSLDGSAITLEASAVKELGESLHGSLLLSGDFGYDGARSVWNGMHDRYPALIVRAADAEDVCNAVTFARERRLLLSVKGGGHSWPGKSVADRAMMIDLSALRGVIVDVARRRARVGGGALLADLDLATLRHGLATTTGVVSHTGVGGYTLGGGYGRLARKCGLTIDNLLSARIVTADGRTTRVSADENAELFWAIRGGGGNFGVVTEFEYALHEIDPMVLGGRIVWPLDQASDVLKFYAEYSAELSDDTDVSPNMWFAPDGTGILMMGVTYFGDPERGEKELAPLMQFGRPALTEIGLTPYLTLQTQEDGEFRPGVRSYAKSGMVREFTPGLIEAIVESFDPARGVGVGSHSAGGAVARVDETATAYPHRDAVCMIGAFTVWTDPADDEKFIKANREQWAALEPHTVGYYENIQSEVKGVRSNFGPDYERLVAVKNKYDPMNLFRLNTNIKPTV